MEMSRLLWPSFTEWIALFALFFLLQVMKNLKHSCWSSVISMRSYPPQQPLVLFWTHLPPSFVFFFFLSPPHPLLSFSCFFPSLFFFLTFFFCFYSFFPDPPLTQFFFPFLFPPLPFHVLILNLCVYVCACVFWYVCACVFGNSKCVGQW